MVTDQPTRQKSFVKLLKLCIVSSIKIACWLGEQKGGLDARNPVFGVCEKQRRRPACAFAPLLFVYYEYHILTCYKRNFKFN